MTSTSISGEYRFVFQVVGIYPLPRLNAHKFLNCLDNEMK